MRGGLERGRPPARLLGSFEQWSRVMGRVLDGVGIAGFLQNLPEFYDRADTERSAWRAFTELWWETHKDREVTTGDLFNLLQGETAQSRGIDFNLKGANDRGQRTS